MNNLKPFSMHNPSTGIVICEAISRFGLKNKLFRAIKENVVRDDGDALGAVGIRSIWNWLQLRNVNQLYSVWVRSGFKSNLEPVVIGHVEDGNVAYMKNLELTTRGTREYTILQYELNDSTGFPVGFFRTAEEAGKYCGGSALRGTITECLRSVEADDDGTSRWTRRSENNIGACGEKFTMKKVGREVDIVLNSANEISDFLGYDVSFIRSCLNIARINKNKSVVVSDWTIVAGNA